MKAREAQPFELDRGDDVPLRFRGWLLARASSRRDGPNGQRWTELAIYRTASGKYVAQTVGRSTVAGEVDLWKAIVCESPRDVVESFRRRGALTNLAKEVVEVAAARDPGFAKNAPGMYDEI